MTATTQTEALNAARANYYRFLRRFYFQEVDTPLWAQLRQMNIPADCPQPRMAEGYEMLRDFLTRHDADILDELAADFAKVFLASGEYQGKGAFPYESVYTSRQGLVRQQAWEQVRGIYDAAGLTLTGAPSEIMEDHIATELEYMALLAEQGTAAPTQQLNFLTQHLLNWVPRLCADMKKYARTDFYKAVALLTEGFFFSLIISIFAVLSVDYIFTPPYWNVSFTLSGFPLTFLVTMTISVVTGIVTSRAKQMDEVRREAELERMHGNLLRAVSHDIRTPLTGIVGATNVLLEQENTLTPEQRHELIRNANEEAQWLIRIVENLLSITRMGGDEAKVNKTPEAAEEIIEGAVGKFTRRWGTDIPVEVRLPEEFLLVPMDPLLMEQVLTNLMENAVLHGKTTRHITVTLCRSGDWARFIVEDDGQGIAPDRLEHLFDGTLQGQQGDRGRSMGIGLSVCRTVVRAHGGHIRGENRTEGGARFTVELPLDKEIQQEVDSYEDQG